MSRPRRDAAPGPQATVTILERTEPLFDPIARGPFVDRLRGRIGPGTVFVVTTPTAAKILRAGLGLPDASVRVVPMPLVPGRVPQPANPDGEDVLAIGPVAYPTVLSCMALLRVAGLDRRCVLAAPDAARLTKPGGEVGRFGLMGGREAVTVTDWRKATASAGVILLGEQTADIGATLREALATGRPVVAPATPLVSDHLACIGAGAYLYPGSGDVAGLTRAVAAALRRDRGTALEAAARDAVLRESWTEAARGLYGALHEALRPAPRTLRSGPEASGDGLAVCVLNPHASGGGGERFLRAARQRDGPPRVAPAGDARVRDRDGGRVRRRRAGVGARRGLGGHDAAGRFLRRGAASDERCRNRLLLLAAPDRSTGDRGAAGVHVPRRQLAPLRRHGAAREGARRASIAAVGAAIERRWSIRRNSSGRKCTSTMAPRRR